jgi:proline racemase
LITLPLTHAALGERFASQLITIDSHTAGEMTRLIVGGVDPVPGETMADKLAYLKNHQDDVRLRLTREPRGHHGVLAALVTEPVTEGAGFGLIYMDGRRYPYLCGHATIGAVTTLIETGALKAEEPETIITIDTPSGPMTASAAVQDGRVASVAIRMAPSFIYGDEQPLEVPGLGRIPVHLVCVGGFFAMVPADAVGLTLTPNNAPRLIDLGMAIIDAANDQLTVRHPERPEVTTVDVTEFYAPDGDDRRKGRGAVIYGESHIDRSPCGTGTAAKLTLLHSQGKLKPGEIYENRSPLDTVFQARIVEETPVGDLPGVIVEIRGSAHITGVHTFIMDPEDPFPKGFIL